MVKLHLFYLFMCAGLLIKRSTCLYATKDRLKIVNDFLTRVSTSPMEYNTQSQTSHFGTFLCVGFFPSIYCTNCETCNSFVNINYSKFGFTVTVLLMLLWLIGWFVVVGGGGGGGTVTVVMIMLLLLLLSFNATDDVVYATP